MIFYRCNFCKDSLAPSPPQRWQWVTLLILIRPYSCPHCQEVYLRPILSLRNLFGRPSKNDRESTSVKGWQATPGFTKPDPPPESNAQIESESRSSDDETGDGEQRRSSRRRKSSSSRSSQAKRQARELRRKDAIIASLSNQSRPTKYRSTGFPARAFRKLRRQVRKLFRISGNRNKGGY